MNIALAASLAQVAVLGYLRTAKGIDWRRVTIFHLDEYVGLPPRHLASCRKFVVDNFVNHLSDLAEFVPVNGDAQYPAREAERLNEILRNRTIHVCFAGIGENTHLAFNDPPADFGTDKSYIMVALDDECRGQLLAEGWFATSTEIPTHAITMSIPQIMLAETLVLSIFGSRKKQAAIRAVEGPLSPMCPASILRLHPKCEIFMDEDAMGLGEARPLINLIASRSIKANRA